MYELTSVGFLLCELKFYAVGLRDHQTVYGAV
jgi:hypothetical protein